MISFKSVFLYFMFFLLSCVETKEKDISSRARSKNKENKKEDSRGDLEDSDRRGSEIRRLKNKNKIIEVELERRYDGGYYYAGYGGAECRDSDSCLTICETQVPRQNRKRCGRSPRALVESLEDGFYTLLNISEVDSVDINPGLIAGMLDINVDLVSDLVEDDMSEGDLKSFLAWVAINESIAEVFLEEDRRSEVMKQAFKKLGELQTDSRRDKETGLNLGLIKDEDTFFHLSALEDNEASFKIAYDILKSACSKKDCKLEILCARKLQSRTRSRIFGPRSSFLNCRTAATQGRRTRREATCYVHGAATWSFLNGLIEDEDIREKNFKGEENHITVETCNKYCGPKDSEKCKRIR